LIGQGIEASRLLRRAEVQVRPASTEEKTAWAMLGPSSFWTITKSVRTVAEFIGIPAEGNMVRAPSAPADLERRKTLLSAQYSDAVVALIEDLLPMARDTHHLGRLLASEVAKRKRQFFRQVA
jgi:hypothetical protein